jgi:hypothetical protein
MTTSELNAYEVIRAREVIFTRESFGQVVLEDVRSAGTGTASEESPSAGSK